MQIKINKLPKSRVEIFFELSWLEFQPFLERAASKLSGNLNVPGFRPGKVPPEILEKEIGQGKILTEGAKLAIKQVYPQLVREKKLEVIGSPQVEILKLAKGNPFSFRARVEILPEIQLPDYKKIAAETSQKEVSVEEKEIQEALNWLQKSRAKFKDLERVAQKGDFLEIEYTMKIAAPGGASLAPAGRENGKTFHDRFFLGKGHFVPGFEENLEGMKKEEEKEFTIPFPKDYFQKELACKDVNFKVKVKKIQKMELPELNDEFAKSLGRFENLEKLKESLKQGIKQEKEMAEKQRRRNEILEKIAREAEFEIPQSLISLEKERMLNDLKRNVEKELKISFGDYLGKIRKSEEELKDSLGEEAEKRVKNFLVLRQIGKKEGVKVSEEEIETAVNGFLKNLPEERVKKEIDPERLKSYYRGIIYNEKTFQILENLK
ncbi:trigger factor [bacterium]|nr:trigger factor [bacterium]